MTDSIPLDRVDWTEPSSAYDWGNDLIKIAPVIRKSGESFLGEDYAWDDGRIIRGLSGIMRGLVSYDTMGAKKFATDAYKSGYFIAQIYHDKFVTGGIPSMAIDRDETITSFKHLLHSYVFGNLLPADWVERYPKLTALLRKIHIVPGKVVEFEAIAPGMHEWLLGFSAFFRQKGLPVPLHIRTQGTVKRIEADWKGPFSSESFVFTRDNPHGAISDRVYTTEHMRDATRRLVRKARQTPHLLSDEEHKALKWIENGSPGHDKKAKQNGHVANSNGLFGPAWLLIDNSGSEAKHALAGDMVAIRTKDPRGLTSNFAFTARGAKRALTQPYSNPFGLNEKLKFAVDMSGPNGKAMPRILRVDKPQNPVDWGYRIHVLERERPKAVWQGYLQATDEMVKTASAYRKSKHPIRAPLTTDYTSNAEALSAGSLTGSIGMLAYLGIRSGIDAYRRSNDIGGFATSWGKDWLVASGSMGLFLGLEHSLIWVARFKGFRYPALISLALGGAMSLYSEWENVDSAAEGASLFAKGVLVDGAIMAAGTHLGAWGVKKTFGHLASSNVGTFAKGMIGTGLGVEANAYFGGHMTDWLLA